MIGGRILVVDDDESLRRVTQVQLEQLGYRVETAREAQHALELLKLSPFELVITDLKMPGMSGLDLLRRIRADFPDVQVILITAFGTIETAVEAMKAGAYDYVTKPVHPDELKLAVRRAFERVRLIEEVVTLRSSLDRKYGFENILGHSSALHYVLDQAARAAQTDSPVLIEGETGTGKELLAKGIHFNSPRKTMPFVTINCVAIPRELIESELFGHVKGSFTGAIAHKKGKIEIADGGTVFFDEIGELPLEMQIKLLRLIQEREVDKIGALTAAKVDVRIVSATNRNLRALVEDGNFREDLFYRLAVIPLQLPPLRERSEDIPELVEHFFQRSRQKHGRGDLVLAPELMPYFLAYRWPGNIRELENVIERMVVLARTGELTVADLPELLRSHQPASPVDVLQLELPPRGISLESVERELIWKALERCDWNQTRAARYLDISRKTLIYRMEKFGIRKTAPDQTPT
jgi:two-component system NtrC family response regulator